MNDTELIPAEVSEPPQVELSVGRLSKPLKSAFSFLSQKVCVVRMQMRASSLPRQAGDGKAICGSAFPFS